MNSGSAVAFVLLRVPRGQARPSEVEFKEAIARDRKSLGQPAPISYSELEITGPIPVTVDGSDLDEYAVWER